MEGGSYRPSNVQYLMTQEDDFVANIPGGHVEVYTAAAALNIGDAVFLSAAHTVNKSVTPANYQAAVGIVVGGQRVFDNILQDDLDIGTQAAATGERVIVCISGRCKAVSDAAVAAAAKITGGAVTAGRVDDALATAGQILGIALEAAGAAGVVILVKVNPH